MREQSQSDAIRWLKELARKTAAFRVLPAKLDTHPAFLRGPRRDLVVEVVPTNSRRRLAFVVEVRRQVTPQIALGILERISTRAGAGLPLLCSPTISPRIQQLCRQYAVNYLDEAGNCRIAAPGLFIERQGLGTVRKERPRSDLFANKASRIVRAMLSDPSRGWQVQQLARWGGLGVSLGLASRVKQALLEQGFAVERDRLLYVRDPDDLLRAWGANYRPRVEPIPLYVTGEPQQAEAAIAQWCVSNGARYALTQFSGAWRSAPAVRYQRSTIYVHGLHDESWENLREFGGARRVDTGANVVLWRTYDPAIFLGERVLGEPPLNVVSALQLYLDLKQLHGRGEEAAQAVYDAEIAPTFAEATRSSR